MTERFTETLRLACASDWSAAVGHRFVRELCDGTISDAAMGPIWCGITGFWMRS